jgi:phosphoribosylformimino-5-aminoimidazole carboxamide ribonucleotide (ProFAR) isomerase
LRAHDEQVVVSVDAREGRVALQGWTQSGEEDAAEVVTGLSRQGVRRFVFTPIEVDGTMRGPGLEELGRVAGATDAELIYSGGIGELEDLRALAEAAPENVAGVIVGRALYEGRFTITQGQRALDA